MWLHRQSLVVVSFLRGHAEFFPWARRKISLATELSLRGDVVWESTASCKDFVANSIIITLVRVYAHVHPSVRIYIIMSGIDYYSFKCKRLLKFRYF